MRDGVTDPGRIVTGVRVVAIAIVMTRPLVRPAVPLMLLPVGIGAPVRLVVGDRLGPELGGRRLPCGPAGLFRHRPLRHGPSLLVDAVGRQTGRKQADGAAHGAGAHELDERVAVMARVELAGERIPARSDTAERSQIPGTGIQMMADVVGGHTGVRRVIVITRGRAKGVRLVGAGHGDSVQQDSPTQMVMTSPRTTDRARGTRKTFVRSAWLRDSAM